MEERTDVNLDRDRHGFLACFAVMAVLVARAPIMDVDPDLVERAGRIAEREAWLKSRKRGAIPWSKRINETLTLAAAVQPLRCDGMRHLRPRAAPDENGRRDPH